MLKLKKIAVTGGLSCGKTSVCRFFKALGAYVVSADEIVHQLLSPSTTLGQQVISLIGSDVVVNQQIDRSQIAKKVFNQPQLLQSLENLLHPQALKEIEKYYLEVSQKQLAPLFVVEIPLLFEIDADKFFDYTVAVIADQKACRQRFIETTGYDKEEYDRRMARQLSPEEKAYRADYTITNNGALADMQPAVAELFKKLTQ